MQVSGKYTSSAHERVYCMQYNAVQQRSDYSAHFNNKGYISIHTSLQAQVP